MNQIPHKPTRWDLQRLYPNECDQTLSNELNEIKILIHYLKEETYSKFNTESFIDKKMLQSFSDVRSRLKKAEYYCYCLMSESKDYSTPTSLHNKITSLKDEAHSLLSDWQKYINKLPAEIQKEWYSLPFVQPFISDLSTNIYTGIEEQVINFTRNELNHWKDMYTQLKNKLEIEFIDDDNKKVVSFSEVNDLAMNHDDPINRMKAFELLTSKLDKEKDLFGTVFNNFARLRLSQNDALQKDDILSDSLHLNGISRKSLFTMWETIDKNFKNLTRFLDFKKNNVEKLTWHQLMTSQQNEQRKMPFSKAVEEIFNSFKIIDDEIAQFALHVITDGWVDAEPRANKPPGGFCAPFLSEGESRISLRYDGTIESARILAHEIGHAWHFKQLKDAPSLSFLKEHFPMSIAECSSILFELIFVDHLITVTSDLEVKQSLLNYKIQSSLNYLMAIRGSFIFEQLFYEESKGGPLSPIQIEELSIESQKRAYGDSLEQYQPFVWIKYGHFYEPNIPFYNYPYTFGYLLSLGLLATAKQDGSEFNSKYKRFLGETEKRPVEELVYDYFNIDLSNPKFWQQSINQIIKDIEEYIHLSNS
ncbi:Oligoendopeptidase F [Bacillus sp. 491mf]|nr:MULTISPECIES: M3 family metallopeptidase [unclassified Bacillus (in: firmicutes)]SFD19845.1 Oligoendopeptidase F [Bacillus sp. 491mf]